MRLIDADALLEESYYIPVDVGDEYGPITEEVVHVSSIRTAPTIDPVKRGKWVKKDGLYGYECTVCWCATGFNHYLFCPFCGAKMLNEEQEREGK